MILQPLVKKWKDEGHGIVVGGDVVCILAFPDDTFLFDRTHRGIRRMLAELSAVLRAAGQALQPDKSVSGCRRVAGRIRKAPPSTAGHCRDAKASPSWEFE